MWTHINIYQGPPTIIQDAVSAYSEALRMAPIISTCTCKPKTNSSQSSKKTVTIDKYEDSDSNFEETVEQQQSREGSEGQGNKDAIHAVALDSFLEMPSH